MPVSLSNTTKFQMNRFVLSLKAITLMEILVSLVLMSVVLVTLSNIFMSAKGGLQHSSAGVNAASLSKAFLDPLQMDVRTDTWDTGIGSNNLTTGSFQGPNQTVNRITFRPNYTVMNVTSDGSNTTNGATNTGLRKVVLNITWNETGF